MTLLRGRLPNRQNAAMGVAGALALTGAWALLGPYQQLAFFLVVAVAIFGGVIYLAWRADPAWTLTVGLLLSVFGGKWDQLGIPTTVAPDRIVLFTGLAGVIARAPGSRARALFRAEPVHVAFVVVIGYALVSAVAVGTFLDRDAMFVLLEKLGVIPFLLFVCATSVFRAERQRKVLLVGLVALGGYLGLTALFETLNVPLVFPAYINDPAVGILPDRARGPFAEPATNGLALFICAGACLVALQHWRARAARLACWIIAALCCAGLLFTVTRQVWLAAVLAGLVTMLTLTRLRRLILPSAAVAAIAIGVLLAVVPGLSTQATERRTQQDTVWDRINLNTAAINAIEAHPLVGVGWQNFQTQAPNYAELNPNFPLTAVGVVGVHNVFLIYGSELGLVGLTVWVIALLIGCGGTLLRRGPPELVPWWALALSAGVFYVAIGSFEFPQVFSSDAIWLLAGVVRAGQLAAEDDQAVPFAAPPSPDRL